MICACPPGLWRGRWSCRSTLTLIFRGRVCLAGCCTSSGESRASREVQERAEATLSLTSASSGFPTLEIPVL
ncbi:hypothetical protein SRHO_G00345100 [Serrasalmus rhombeus]